MPYSKRAAKMQVNKSGWRQCNEQLTYNLRNAFFVIKNDDEEDDGNVNDKKERTCKRELFVRWTARILLGASNS